MENLIGKTSWQVMTTWEDKSIIVCEFNTRREARLSKAHHINHKRNAKIYKKVVIHEDGIQHYLKLCS